MSTQGFGASIFAKALVVHSLLAAALFGASGDLRWSGAWIYLALTVGSGWSALFALEKVSPDLIEERNRFRKDAKSFDKILAPLVMLTPLVVCLVAGLDRRFGWSDWRDPRLAAAGAILMIAAATLIFRAMLANRFFSALVRIQKDRGHRVVTEGPYRRIRHPGYTGLLLVWCSMPLLLGSRIAFAAVAAGFAILIVRTSLEDRTLTAELEGYADYAARVRYRLLPGVW